MYTDTLRKNICNDHGKSPITITRICGPIKKINDTTFTLSFYRMGFNNSKRTSDFWLIAATNGDENYKSTVQQVNIRIPYPNMEGKEQYIRFKPISNVKMGTASISLNAVSDLGLPVCYYVQEGPAEINGEKLLFTSVPPRTKFPVKITVVAWQYGSSIEPKVQTAEPVVQTFYLEK
jgi:hypothetical protein